MNLNEEEFNAWVHKIYRVHNDVPYCTCNNVKQLEATCIAQDQHEIETRLNRLASTIDTERVDLFQFRCKGIWLQKENCVKMIDQVGTIVLSLGTQNAFGKFLSCFEALFLLETNRLEIIEDDIPWTMKRAYQTLLKNSGDITKYKCYRKHALDGSLNGALLQSVSSIHHEQQCKKMKVDHSDNLPSCEESSSTDMKTFTDIFHELQANGPQGMRFLGGGADKKKLKFLEMKELGEKLLQGTESYCYTNGEPSMIRAQIVNTPPLPFESKQT